MAGKIYVGIGGWTFEPWRGRKAQGSSGTRTTS